MWARFGPYHLARLKGAARAMPEAEVIGIEIAGDDRDYAWEHAPGADGFKRTTIFADRNYHDLSPQQIASGVRETLSGLRPHVIAINGWGVPEGRAALAWARRHGARAILMSESKADDRPRVWWKEIAKSTLVRRFDAALVGGHPHAEYLVNLGFPSDRIRYGYDAIDNAYFEAGSDAARARASEHRVSLQLPKRYFFACTRLLKRKNIDGLLRAYAAHRARAGDSWGLVIAGSGEEEQSLKQLASDLGIENSVHWPGFVQYRDLPTYFGLASAFVHPAKSEAWGLVVNEAAASALPLLVASPVGAASELVCDGTGFLFEPSNDADIERALTTLTAMPEEQRAELGRNARSRAAGWSPARFADGLRDILPSSHAVRLR